MKKVKHPVTLEKFFHYGWPGFTGPRSIGDLFLTEWPDEHPDSHCQKGVYTPDDFGVCECGWVPADKAHCTACDDTVRRKKEERLLRKMVSASNHGPQKVLHAAYLGYCELFAEKLSCTPDVDAVIQWFNGLKEKKKGELLNKHLPNMSVSISIMGFGQLPDTDGLLEMITKDLFNGIPDEVLRQFLDIPDIPEEVAAIIKNLLEKEEETIH